MKNIVDVLQKINTSLFEQFLPFFEMGENTVIMYNQKYHVSFKIMYIPDDNVYILNCYDENNAVVQMVIKKSGLTDLEFIKPNYIKFLNSATQHQSKLYEKHKNDYISRIKYLIEKTNYKKIDKYQEFLFVCGTNDGMLFSVKNTDIFVRIYNTDELDMCVINKSSISYLKRHRILKMLTVLADIYIFG